MVQPKERRREPMMTGFQSPSVEPKFGLADLIGAGRTAIDAAKTGYSNFKSNFDTARGNLGAGISAVGGFLKGAAARAAALVQVPYEDLRPDPGPSYISSLQNASLQGLGIDRLETWTNVTGEHSTQARYRGISGAGSGNAILNLEKADGSTVGVPQGSLSKDSLNLARKYYRILGYAKGGPVYRQFGGGISGYMRNMGGTRYGNMGIPRAAYSGGRYAQFGGYGFSNYDIYGNPIMTDMGAFSGGPGGIPGQGLMNMGSEAINNMRGMGVEGINRRYDSTNRFNNMAQLQAMAMQPGPMGERARQILRGIEAQQPVPSGLTLKGKKKAIALKERLPQGVRNLLDRSVDYLGPPDDKEYTELALVEEIARHVGATGQFPSSNLMSAHFKRNFRTGKRTFSHLGDPIMDGAGNIDDDVRIEFNKLIDKARARFAAIKTNHEFKNIDLYNMYQAMPLFPYHYAKGGLVPSYFRNGGSNQDTVPAMLTPGEFVMNSNTVDKYGVGFMKSLNRGQVPGYNKGGPVYRNQGSGGREGTGGGMFAIDTGQIEGVFSGFIGGITDAFAGAISSFDPLITKMSDAAALFANGFQFTHTVNVQGGLNLQGLNIELIKNELSQFIGEFVGQEVAAMIDQNNSRFIA
tara:strand:- start:378 stop:2285 length:1908 start_codon:yes stop_codon:yes gene_type:complete